MSSGLRITREDKVSVFTLDRPAIKNAINAATAEHMFEALAEFDQSDQRVAIITGAGKHFSGGADLGDLPILWKSLPTLGVRTEKPVITAVNGDCVGGAFVIAMLSDLCVASENAIFHYPEAKVGVTGGVAATLAGRIAQKHAMEILLFCRKITAQRGYEMGLVNEVVPQGQALNRALEMAHELAEMAPMVLAALKRFVGETLPKAPSEKMADVSRQLDVIRQSEDRARGVEAFLAGEQATFNGR